MHASAPATLLLALAALLLGACSSSSYGRSGASSTSVAPRPTASVAANPPLTTTTLRYDGGALAVEVAATTDQRTRGLSGRDSLAPDAGMLFDLETTGITSFWMKDMRFPLDMIWITEDTRIAGVTADVQPQPGVPDSELRLYPPPAPVRYVLELNAGAAGERGLTEGSQLTFAIP